MDQARRFEQLQQFGADDESNDSDTADMPNLGHEEIRRKLQQQRLEPVEQPDESSIVDDDDLNPEDGDMHQDEHPGDEEHTEEHTAKTLRETILRNNLYCSTYNVTGTRLAGMDINELKETARDASRFSGHKNAIWLGRIVMSLLTYTIDWGNEKLGTVIEGNFFPMPLRNNNVTWVGMTTMMIGDGHFDDGFREFHDLMYPDEEDGEGHGAMSPILKAVIIYFLSIVIFVLLPKLENIISDPDALFTLMSIVSGKQVHTPSHTARQPQFVNTPFAENNPYKNRNVHPDTPTHTANEPTYAQTHQNNQQNQGDFMSSIMNLVTQSSGSGGGAGLGALGGILGALNNLGNMGQVQPPSQSPSYQTQQHTPNIPQQQSTPHMQPPLDDDDDIETVTTLT